MNQIVFSPQQAWLAIANVRLSKSPLPEEGFLVVLCWLENDDGGQNTRLVEQAFSNVEGITLRRSPFVVKAFGAGTIFCPG